MLTKTQVEMHKTNLEKLSKNSLVSMFVAYESTIFDSVSSEDIETISKDTLIWMLTVHKYGWFNLRDIYGTRYMLGY